jgi:serine/threonine protein kinase
MRHQDFIRQTADNGSFRAMPTEEALIGTYRILEPIGEGGMGTVYLGEHTLLGRKAAIKVLLPSLSADAEIVERFFNEARALTMICDPGIVQIFDFGYHSDGRAFMIMELLDGEPMSRRLKRVRRIGAIECLRLARLMASSLETVHAKGIVHRDLKPGNMFIVGDATVAGGERVKIFDFGIAKQSGNGVTNAKTRAGVLMGTPMYMSPEQCRGVGEIDHRSDIYSLGCVMFTMLTSQPPFGRRAPGDLVVAHLRRPPPLASSYVASIPSIVDDILQRCLKKSPSERFQSMSDLAQAIESAEQVLIRSSAANMAVEAQNVHARRSSSRMLDGQIGARAASKHDLAPRLFEANAIPSGPTTLNMASGQTHAPMSLAESTSRRRIASVIMVAALIGSLGAIFVSRTERGGSAILRSAPTPVPTAGTRADAIPARRPEIGMTSGTAESTPPSGSAKVATSVPGAGVSPASQVKATSQVKANSVPNGSSTRPQTTQGSRQRPLHDAKGKHASSTGSAAPPDVEQSQGDQQRDDPANTDRGD